MALILEKDNNLKRKKDKGLCIVKGCHRKAYVYVGKKKTRTFPYCTKHRHDYVKETNPANYFYHVLKQNAKRRGKEFSI